ncbi:MAG: DMT family transporter [Dehalococcoidia bacterium]
MTTLTPGRTRTVPQWWRVPTTIRWGIGLAFAAAIVSGFSVWVNSYAVKEVRDPAVFTTAKNLTVGLVLVAALLSSSSKQSPRPRTKTHWTMLLSLGIVGGSVPFVLFFEGLSQSGPGNAAFIQKTLFIWVAILAVPLLGERVGRWQVAALGLLLCAQLLIGRPSSWAPGRGELMVLAATAFWTVETVIARRLLPEVGVLLGATTRMGLGGIALFAYLTVQGKLGAFFGLDAEQWRWVVSTSAILLVYVTVWYAALRRAPATVVTSILTLGAPITALLATWSGKPSPSGEQMLGYAILAVGLAVVAVATRPAHTSQAALA